MKSTDAGFTLIELMMVVAIVSIMSAIAIPQYQAYILKSRITAAVSELSGGRSQYELIMNDGATSTAFTVDNIGLTVSSYCDFTVHQPDASGDSEPAIECTLRNVGLIAGESVYLNRLQGGSWTCTTSAGIDARYKPAICI